ncbi:MAG: hypothetical protein JJE46_15070, partial [Acidimicrobiia bacterium]|nr:hypothetical protein [Acidimicrobiia bacterium]
GDLRYDLAISAGPRRLPTLADAGISTPAAAVVPAPLDDRGTALWPVGLGVLVALAGFVWMVRRTGRSVMGSDPTA